MGTVGKVSGRGSCPRILFCGHGRANMCRPIVKVGRYVYILPQEPNANLGRSPGDGFLKATSGGRGWGPLDLQIPKVLLWFFTCCLFVST